MITELNERSREIFSRLVDTYLKTGAPVGSRLLSGQLSEALSPASVRAVMAELETAGLLHAPHASAGRLPTPQGLRLFVDGLLEIGRLPEGERRVFEERCAARGRSVPEVLTEATRLLSDLSACAGLVLAPKTDRPLKHIEFVPLSPGRALVVLVTEDGLVENRIVDVPLGLGAQTLIMASNYLGARLSGRSLAEAKTAILDEIQNQKAEIDRLTAKVVEQGLAVLSDGDAGGRLIVRGQAHLLEDVHALEDLEHIRLLFEGLETNESLVRLIEATGKAEGVKVFLGAESPQFQYAGCAMVIAPYKNTDEKVAV